MSSRRSNLSRRLTGRPRAGDGEVRQPPGAAQIGPGWLWPYWMERQLDPGSPAFTPWGDRPFPANLTHRNWTMVGNLGSRHRGIVDPRGLVTPWSGSWSLDWWVGAEDRWHLPSREQAVRQALLDGGPVVETVMRIPGGEAVHRAYAVRAEAELIVIEVENRSATPVALALALRPYNPEGLAMVEQVTADGLTVLADGCPALLLPRPPAGVAGSTLEGGDSVHAVMAGQTGPWPFPPVDDRAGLAQAAFVYPLPHRTTLRFAVPLTGVRSTPPRVGPAPPHLSARPAAADVARGWKAQLRRGTQLGLPDAKLQAAVDANRAFMLLFDAGDEIVSGAYQLSALDRFGFHAEAAEVLRSYPGRQQRDGRFGSGHGQDSNGAAIYAMAEHHRLCSDGVAAETLEALSSGTRWLAEHPGPSDGSYWDGFWALRGLVDGAWLLRSFGDEAAAAGAEAAAAGLRQSISASLDLAAARNRAVAMPAGPLRGLDAGMIGSLVACSPLQLLAPEDPWVTGTLDIIRERFCLGDAFFQAGSRTGLGTSTTLQLGFCELEAGDPRAARRLRWMLDAATSTFTWPEAIHPKLGTGCVGDGHHGWAAADFLTLIRHSLVRELRGGGGLALCSLFPPDWAGLPVEVHHAPTHYGRVSFAIRWHDDRPALLWELEGEGTRLTIPGLDPTWSSTERTGEALLRPFRARVRIPLSEA